jgi:uncharacterized protein YeaO (DUF488 family)
MAAIAIKRVYDGGASTDGMRILVDRLWPRGVSKDAAALDLWAKEVAPSPSLRTWFEHREDRFAEFKKRYLLELSSLTSSARSASGKLPCSMEQRIRRSTIPSCSLGIWHK